jgi:hypothetical protein
MRKKVIFLGKRLGNFKSFLNINPKSSDASNQHLFTLILTTHHHFDTDIVSL